MNPTRPTPTGIQPTRPHPNPAGTASKQTAATDQRGGAKRNPAAGTQNIVQPPTPDRTLRAANPTRNTRLAPNRRRTANPEQPVAIDQGRADMNPTGLIPTGTPPPPASRTLQAVHLDRRTADPHTNPAETTSEQAAAAHQRGGAEPNPAGTQNIVQPPTPDRTPRATNPTRNSRLTPTRQKTAPAPQPTATQQGKRDMDPTELTPTGAPPPPGSPTFPAADLVRRPHPNPAGTASEPTAATDQRGEAKPNPAAGTQNIAQPLTRDRTLRATNPTRRTQLAPNRQKTAHPEQPAASEPGRADMNPTELTPTEAAPPPGSLTLPAADPSRRPHPNPAGTMGEQAAATHQRGVAEPNPAAAQDIVHLPARDRTLRAANPTRNTRLAPNRRRTTHPEQPAASEPGRADMNPTELTPTEAAPPPGSLTLPAADPSRRPHPNPAGTMGEQAAATHQRGGVEPNPAAGTQNVVQPLTRDRTLRASNPTRNSRLTPTRQKTAPAPQPTATQQGKGDMNQTGRTPTEVPPPPGSPTFPAADPGRRPHPNPAGTASEPTAAIDQRGGVEPNPAAGTQNVVQLPTPGRALRATNPNLRPALHNPPRPRRRNRLQKLQRRQPNPNATGRTQTAAKLLALGRTLRAASPNPRARFAPYRRPATRGLRILNNPPQPNPPHHRRNRLQGPQRRQPNPNATGRTQTAAKLLALGRTLRAAHRNHRARFAIYRRPAAEGLRILDYQPHATGGEERI